MPDPWLPRNYDPRAAARSEPERRSITMLLDVASPLSLAVDSFVTAFPDELNRAQIAFGAMTVGMRLALQRPEAVADLFAELDAWCVEHGVPKLTDTLDKQLRVFE